MTSKLKLNPKAAEFVFSGDFVSAGRPVRVTALSCALMHCFVGRCSRGRAGCRCVSRFASIRTGCCWRCGCCRARQEGRAQEAVGRRRCRESRSVGLRRLCLTLACPPRFQTQSRPRSKTFRSRPRPPRPRPRPRLPRLLRSPPRRLPRRRRRPRLRPSPRLNPRRRPRSSPRRRRVWSTRFTTRAST